MINFLLPLTYYVKADSVGQQQWEAVLAIITKGWGIYITRFFYMSPSSKKHLCQIAYFLTQSQICSNINTCKIVNEYVIHHLILYPLRPSCQYETTIADWVVVENFIYLLHDISQAQLSAAGVYLRLFDKILSSVYLIYFISPFFNLISNNKVSIYGLPIISN